VTKGSVRWRDRLVVRLTGLVVLVGLAVGVAGSAVILVSARRALRADLHQRNLGVADELAARLDARVEYARSLLLVAATRMPIAAASTTDLRAVLRTANVFDQLVLYDLQGAPVAAAASAFLADPAQLPARPELRQGTNLPGARVRPGFPPSVEITVPIERPAGLRIGTITGISQLDTLATPLTQLDPEGQNRIFTDADGLVLVHPERERVLAEQRYPVRGLAHASRAGSVRFEGDRRVAAVAMVPTLGGYVVLDQAERDALAPARERIRELVMVLVVLVLTTVVAVGIGAAWLLRPITALAAAVRRIGAGDRGVRAAVQGRSELGVLASELNNMAIRRDRHDAEIASLHQLSIRLTAASDSESLAEQIIAGARLLVGADEAALFLSTPEGSLLAAAATDRFAGDRLQPLAAAAVASGPTGEDTPHVAVRLTGPDGRVAGAIAVGREAPPIEAAELYVLDAYGQAATAAIHAVTRLALERELASQLERTVQERRDLVGAITHEFRTPLACVTGFSDVLLQRWDALPDAERREMVTKVLRHGKELDALVNQLLDFWVSDRGALTPEPRPLALRPILDDLVRDLAPVLGAHPIRIDMPADVVEMRVEADETLLRRAVTNLLSNAAKYSASGSPIVLRALARGSEVQIDVVDRGVGLSEEESARVFEPFWRSDNPATRGARGTGLGLSLVTQYANAMGGSVAVASKPTVGSTFSLRLPRFPWSEKPEN
jgi:signal transduction histidine kinase